MKKLFPLLSVLFLIFGCTSEEPINLETKLFEKDGVYYTKDTNTPYSGRVFSLHENGEKSGEGTLKDGTLDGLYTTWYDNGQKETKGSFKDEVPDGLYTIWYKNGQKKEEYTFKDGGIDGLSTEWYENGKKKEEWTLKNMVFDGLYTKWYENGQKKEEKTYKFGKEVSSKEWNEDGSVKE